MINSEAVLGLPDYQITGIEARRGRVRLSARYTGPIACPHCGGDRLRSKGRCDRQVRHENWGLRHCVLELEARKWQCLECGRHFRQRFPGIQPWQRASEAFQRSSSACTWTASTAAAWARGKALAQPPWSATSRRGLQRQFRPVASAALPARAGHRRALLHPPPGLRHHPVRPAAPQGLRRGAGPLGSLRWRPISSGWKAKPRCGWCAWICPPCYRALVRKHFPNARIVADRFHVIRLINHHFLACWRELDPVGSKNRGLLSLMRRHRHNLNPEQQTAAGRLPGAHPALELIYRFKQRLCYLLLKKHRTRQQCEQLAPRFLRAVYQLRQAGLAQLVAARRDPALLVSQRSPPCGASPATTASPKASTTRWN